MENYKKEFISFMIESGVLLFGDFITKSGRETPYFINTGNYNTGNQMKKLGKFYAAAIDENFSAEEVQVLFGPAYKGIPLTITTSIALGNESNRDISFCFNRKESKDHGERGNFIGKKLENGDKIIIVEDVLTSGISVRESISMLNKAAFIHILGLVVSVDRMERGRTQKNALKEIRDQYNIKTCAIVTLDEIIEFLHNKEINGKVYIDDEMKNKIDEYRAKYGAIDEEI
ncbi:orotate phosphoribosyltransferase [Promethearchaeum syntrophicum]|uniref:Orotate phosphoribosyltransferase n=1 Tax=Promethearchaeum syntrophicum TaxID=2594042 RepID=A0A5B9DBH6_9ARCH|nr:orotate phosphoribosyltransferase [Candidatus Prometheoarchaeum syntrophicum]QEE16528.1 orotate phosphoribosyltransferase [Candidatus Prometheoarchaeum syntrophicum]